MTLTAAWNSPAFDRLRDGSTGHKCGACGRKTPHRKDGTRARHRVEADNPIAAWCASDDPPMS